MKKHLPHRNRRMFTQPNWKSFYKTTISSRSQALQYQAVAKSSGPVNSSSNFVTKVGLINRFAHGTKINFAQNSLLQKC